MRIGIDLSPTVYLRGGMGRYAQELTVALQRVAPEHTYVGFYNRYARGAVPPSPLDQLEHITVPWHNKPWRVRVMLSHYLRWPQDHLVPTVDVFHVTDHLLPYLRHTSTVVTLHDLTYLLTDTHTTLNTLFLKVCMPRFLAQAKAVIVPSTATKHDLLLNYAVRASKVHVIPEGVNARFFDRSPEAIARVCQKHHLPDTFVLTVGTIEPRKNLSRLLDAIIQLRKRGVGVPLVVAGKAGWRSEAVESM